SSTAYPARISRPASPSTWLSRVVAATMPSKPSVMPSSSGGSSWLVNIDSKINIMPKDRFLTAEQAAKALGVTRATLYAYASRGLLRSDAVPSQPRERRYYREDIDRLL